MTHPLRFSALSRAEMLREWRNSRETLADILGEDVTVASIPGGAFSPLVAKTASEAGFRYLFTSEPETRIAVIDGCTILGRYTVRASSRPDFSRRIGQLDRSARMREWVIWNAKQRVKDLLNLGRNPETSSRPDQSLITR